MLCNLQVLVRFYAGVGNEFEIEVGFVVMVHFRALCYLPESRIDRREEGIGVFDNRMDMGDYELIGVCEGLGIDLAASDDVATLEIRSLSDPYAAWRDPTTATSSAVSNPREMTIFTLFGSGRPMDSKVLRPMMTGQPTVWWRKNFMSSEMCHRRALSLPMALLSAIATIMHFSILYSYWSRNSWVRIVIYELEILVFEVEDTLDLRVDLHLRKSARLAAELGRNLLEMIDIDMRISGSMDEFARLKAANLGNHHGQKGVRCDVERHAEEYVRTALIQLA